MKAIAIDGPAGAGKSTIARIVARNLGFIYVDTGALYRAVGLYMVQNGIPLKDTRAITACLPGISVKLFYQEGEQRVLLNGQDVSSEIRTPQTSLAASAVSAVPEVRAFLFDLQQDIAAQNNVVMDGRDIGTVVLPQADVKIFLTATPEDRARRRYEEYLAKGEEVAYSRILAEVKERDANDSNRAAAPLKQAADAFRIDTTGYALEKSIQVITDFIKERLG